MSRGLGDVYKRQVLNMVASQTFRVVTVYGTLACSMPYAAIVQLRCCTDSDGRSPVILQRPVWESAGNRSAVGRNDTPQRQSDGPWLLVTEVVGK